MAENKVEYGIENVYIAPLTDTGKALEYDTPFHYPGTVEVSLSPAGSSDPFYADNIKYFIAQSNQGYTGKFTSARVIDEFLEKILDQKLDSNKNFVENANAHPRNFAMMFRFSGDKDETLHVLYNVQAARAGLDGATKKDKTEIKTTELTLTVSPDPYTKVVKMRTTAETPQEIRDNWFKAVQLPNAQPNPPKGDE